MTLPRIPRWAFALAVAGPIAVGVAISQGWLREPELTQSDYVGTTDVSIDDARLYRAVPFEWRVHSAAGNFTGHDTAYVRIDPSGERTLLCGWLTLDKAGASMRASRWLSEARLMVGDFTILASFIAPVTAAPVAPSAAPGTGGLHAGCAGLYDGLKPAADTALTLEGPAIDE